MNICSRGNTDVNARENTVLEVTHNGLREPATVARQAVVRLVRASVSGLQAELRGETDVGQSILCGMCHHQRHQYGR